MCKDVRIIFVLDIKNALYINELMNTYVLTLEIYSAVGETRHKHVAVSINCKEFIFQGRINH